VSLRYAIDRRLSDAKTLADFGNRRFGFRIQARNFALLLVG
jgi:hypothetical protein